MESLADDKAEAKYGKEAFCIGFNVGAVPSSSNIGCFVGMESLC